MNRNLLFGGTILVLSAIVFITINTLNSFEENLDKEAIEKSEVSLKTKEHEQAIIVQKNEVEKPSFVTNPPEESQPESIDKPQPPMESLSDSTTESNWSPDQNTNNGGVNIPTEDATDSSERVIENTDNQQNGGQQQ